MSCVPTGRVGLTPGVSGFVTHEDKSLEARLKRAARSAGGSFLAKICDVRTRLAGATEPDRARQAPSAAPGGGAATPDITEAVPVKTPDHGYLAETSAASTVPWRKMLRLHAAGALIRGHQLKVLGLAWLRPGDRLRDLAALAWIVLRWTVRAALAAPRWLQVIVLACIGLYLAPWPDGVHAEAEQSVAAHALPTVSPQPARSQSEPWRAVAGAIAAYHLEAPELDKSALKYRARRHVSGARQDMLSWHEDGSDEILRPRNRLSGAIAIEHYPREGMKAETFFTDAARRASLAGLSIEKLSDAYVVHNKFGAFEVADAMLSAGASSRACLMFRHLAGPVPLQIHGWFCGTAQRPLDRSTLSCVLDRVDLLGAGSDQALKSYFAAVERDRKTCGAYRVAAAPAGWVNAQGRVPELKTAIVDRSRRM